jgi:hypothetical protein
MVSRRQLADHVRAAAQSRGRRCRFRRSAFGAPHGLTSRRRLRQGGTPTQVSCARIGRPSGPMLALAERRFDPGRCVARRRPRAPRVGEVTIGADQPHPGSMCAITRVQRLFRGWHVVDGDADRVLRERRLSTTWRRVGCWSLEQQHVMPDAAADVEDAGALMSEATEGRAFAGTRPTVTDSVSSCGSPSANG